jgi:hypothetical protein
MTRTLAGVTLPSPTVSVRETAWMKADRSFLDGTQGRDVTAALRRFRLQYKATAAQITAVRTLFYKTSPLNYIDSTISVDCWVFPAGTLRVAYLPVRPTGGIVATVDLELWEHGAVYAGAATTATEPGAGASAVWSIGGTPVGGPSTYTVEYNKETVAHQLANGTVWIDTIGIQRVWTLGFAGLTTTDIAVWRAAQATLAESALLSPTNEDSASAKVYIEGLPEALLLGTTRVECSLRLVEGVTGGAATPSCKVELDVDGDGTFDGGVEDISAYVVSVSVDRQGIRQEAGPSGVGGGITSQATITVRHAGGLFSPFHADARLTDAFYGKLIRISLGWGGAPTVVFVGRVVTTSEELRQRKATITARDLGGFLMQFKRGDTVLYQNIQSDVYLGAILTQAGMSSGTNPGQYQLDKGNYPLQFAWMDHETYAQECDQVVAMEGGRLYWDMAGVFRFENAAHLLQHTAVDTFTVANMADLGIAWDYDNIANRVVVESTSRYVAVSQIVWEAQETHRVPPRIEADADGVVAGTTATIIRLTSANHYGEDALKGEWLRLTSGTYSGQTRKIKHSHATDADAAGQTWVTVEAPFTGAPAAADGYALGGILDVEAKFQYPATGIVTPVAWTQALQDANSDCDYQATTGGGINATSSVTVATTNDASTIYAASATLYLVNALAEAVYMQRLQVRGSPILARETRRSEEFAQVSIDAYQEREMAIAGEQSSLYVQTEVQAKSVAQMYLARFKDPHAYWQINGVKGNASREIGRRDTFAETESGLARDGFITSIRDSYSPGSGYSQDLTYVDAAMLGITSDGGTDWFMLGTSKYGAAGASNGVNHGHLWV